VALYDTLSTEAHAPTFPGPRTHGCPRTLKRALYEG